MTHDPPATAGEDPWTASRAKWLLALAKMQEALHLLDQSNGPAQIGAQLDLAIQQLRDKVANSQDD